MKPVLILCGLFVCLVGGAPDMSAQEKREQGGQKQNEAKASGLTAGSAGDVEPGDVWHRAALAVIEGEAERARDFREPRAAVLVMARAADLLWENKEDKSREILRRAYEIAKKATPPEAQGESSSLRNLKTDSFRARLCSEVLAVAQRHDAELARELIGKVEENTKHLTSLHNIPLVMGTASEQKQNLARLAQQLASVNPAQAVDLALDSLGYGVPQEFGPIFRTLIDTERMLAYKLFSRSVEVMIADPSLNLYDPIILGTYLRLLPQPESDSALVRRFLDAALARCRMVREQAVSSGKNDEGLNSALVMSLNQIGGIFQTYWPERAPEVYSLLRQILPDSTPADRASGKYFQGDGAPRDADGLLSAAEKEANPEYRDSLILEAALMSSSSGEYDRALNLAGRAQKSEKRDAVTMHIHLTQARKLINGGDLFEAVRIADKIEAPEEMADVALSLVEVARKQAQEQLASEWLRDTLKRLEKRAGEVSFARAYLRLVSDWSRLDPARGMEMMPQAIKLINRVKGLDDIRPETKIIRLGGLSNQAIRVGNHQQNDLLSGFHFLARVDFQGTLLIADGFDNDLLRGLAKLTAVTAVLNSKAHPGPDRK